jgi:hypothetical protein
MFADDFIHQLVVGDVFGQQFNTTLFGFYKAVLPVYSLHDYVSFLDQMVEYYTIIKDPFFPLIPGQDLLDWYDGGIVYPVRTSVPRSHAGYLSVEWVMDRYFFNKINTDPGLLTGEHLLSYSDVLRKRTRLEFAFAPGYQIEPGSPYRRFWAGLSNCPVPEVMFKMKGKDQVELVLTKLLAEDFVKLYPFSKN